MLGGGREDRGDEDDSNPKAGVVELSEDDSATAIADVCCRFGGAYLPLLKEESSDDELELSSSLDEDNERRRLREISDTRCPLEDTVVEGEGRSRPKITSVFDFPWTKTN